MRHCLALLLLFSLAAIGQTVSSPAGTWISVFRNFGEPIYFRTQLELDGTKLTGKFGNDVLEGTFQNGQIEGTGRLVEQKRDMKWEASRQQTKNSPPTTHTFEPTQFHHFFSDAIEPALHVNAGDTVKTWSVDAGGADPKGVRRTSGGNPLTGPFYVEGAIPGDTLVVHFTRIRLNRDSAISSPLIANGALNPGYVEQGKKVEGYDSNWKLDLQAGFASLAKDNEELQSAALPACA